jgi:3-dehydroquinate synthase
VISPVFFAKSASANINELIPTKSSVFVIMDDATHEHCWPVFAENLNNPSEIELIEVQNGEVSKQLTVFAQIAETLCDLGADRNSLIINLGGGMITDLGAYVASAYMRGIEYVNVPTTLLAMVDAAHGGKTGVDLGAYKNLVGAMYPSKAVLVYPAFLETLPVKEFASGYAEALKHGLIANKKLWYKLCDAILPAADIADLLEEIIEVKTKVVREDPLEKNLRKTLNYGHNIGHAIESFFLSEFNPIPHGEAVVMGMIMENEMARNKKLLSEADCTVVNSKLRNLYPQLPSIKDAHKVILENLKKDKKNESGVFYFSPIVNIGEAAYRVAFDANDCQKVLDTYE